METYCELPVFLLRDVLDQIKMPVGISTKGVSSKWRCVIAPRMELSNVDNENVNAEYTTAKYLDVGIPVQWPGLTELRHKTKTKSKATAKVKATEEREESEECTGNEFHSSTVNNHGGNTCNNSLCNSDSSRYNNDNINSSSKSNKICEDCNKLIINNDIVNDSIVLADKVIESEKWHEECVEESWEWYNKSFDKDSKWFHAKFKRPQIAMRNGWDAPGESITSSRFHTFVDNFADVFNSAKRQREVLLPSEHSSTSSYEVTPLSSACTDTISASKVSDKCSKIDDSSCENNININNNSSSRSNNHRNISNNISPLSNIVEMQYFHHSDNRDDEVQLPRFADKLEWPKLFSINQAKFCVINESSIIASQCGVIRQWHMNDGGEFMMQAVLCASKALKATKITNKEFCKCNNNNNNNNHHHEPSVTHEEYHRDKHEYKENELIANEESLLLQERHEQTKREEQQHICELLYNTCDDMSNTTLPVRLVIYGAKNSYDWFVHDDESNVQGVHTLLELLHTPDEALPIDEELLPILTVAVIMSNSHYALLSPPNLPHMSITLNDCIIIEQSRTCELWLDEVSYFLYRCERWTGQPVIYEYLANNLQDDRFVGGQLIPKLVYSFNHIDVIIEGIYKALSSKEYNDNNDDDSSNTNANVRESIANTELENMSNYKVILQRRIVMSLLAIALNNHHFRLNVSSRTSLLQLLVPTNTNNLSEMAEFASSPIYNSRNSCYKSDIYHNSSSVQEFLSNYYWNLAMWWPKPGCVMCIPICEESSAMTKLYIPVVYVHHQPVFGTEKSNIEETVNEYFEMKALIRKPQELYKYLFTRKQHHDELLDELF